MAKTHLTPSSLSRSQLDRATRMDRMIRVQEERVKTLLKKTAVRLTSGNYPQLLIKTLHPYARRHGAPLAPLMPINVDTGRLRKGWRFRKKTRKNARGGTLYNIARYTRYILARQGTKKMFARGFWDALKREYRQQRAEKIRRKQEAEK